MDNEKLYRLLEAVIDLPPDEQDAFIELHCGDDENLKTQLDSLLKGEGDIESDWFSNLAPLKGERGDTEENFSELKGETIAHYLVKEKIGSGGGGDVYFAHDQKLGRPVALKTVRTLRSQSIERLFREAQTLSKVEHPNVCRLYELIQEKNSYFLVMEYVEGSSLAETLKSGPLTLQNSIEISLKIARALASAHQRNIVHRDLKPGNVMISNSGEVKVLDFGLAHIVTPHLEEDVNNEHESSTKLNTVFRTREGVVTGTPMYMSPEQAQGDTLTTASDIYSFGLMLQHMLSGCAPYSNTQNIFQLARDGASEKFEYRLREVRNLVNRMKSQALNIRPTAQELVDRLEWIRLRPRRNFQRALVTLTIFALLVGLFIGSISYTKVKKESEKATQTVELMRELMESVDPSKKGINLKAVDLIKSMGPRLQDLKGYDNQTKADLLLTFGKTLHSLGDYQSAKKFLVEANKFDDSNKEILNELATTLFSLQDYQESVIIHQRSYSLLRQSGYQSDHPDVLTAKMGIAVGNRRLGNYDVAEKINREVLRKRKIILGDSHSHTLNSMNELAETLREIGRHDEAESLNFEALKIKKNVLGPEHPQTLASMHNLANILYDRKKFEEALLLQKEVTEICDYKLGKNHPNTLTAWSNMGNSLRKLELFDEALDTYFIAFDRSFSKRGYDFRSIRLLVNISNTYIGVENYPEANKNADLALGDAIALWGNTDPRTIEVLADLGNAFFDKKQYNEAQYYFELIETVEPDVLNKLCQIREKIE